MFTYDLDLEDMTLGQGHDTPFGNGQQLCEILSESKFTVVNYGPDKAMQCDLDLEDKTLVQVMTHPWVMDNNCMKYYPNPTWLVSYGLDKELSDVCTVTLTLEIMTLV